MAISAIARHLGRDRKTIRAYLNGGRVPGQRRQAPDAFVPFLPYCQQRLADDPHLWASTLFDEVTALGYQGAYSTFTRALRRYQVRPHCEPCHASSGRDVAVIAHPPGEEIQFDWLELPDAPEGGGEWASMPISWSGRSRTRAGGGRCCRSRRTYRTWSRPWTR
jgi:transposase